MKILIVSVADRRHMTPAAIYRDIFKDKGIDYHILCTNRYGETFCDENTTLFPMIMEAGVSKIKKAIYFRKFKKFAINFINKNRYDFIVVWNENTAIILNKFLYKKYYKKYCVNIRDVVSSRISFLQKLLNKRLKYCMDGAVYSTIPSPALEDEYKDCKNVYVLFNNGNSTINKAKRRIDFVKQGESIRLSYMGAVQGSAIETYKRLIDIFSCDERFILSFYGSGNQELAEYLKNKNARNVKVFGPFPPEKTSNILDETDIIIAYYANGLVKNALGIKGSYGPQLYIPQICDPQTYWATQCEKYGFGFAVKDENTLPNDLYNWYRNLDFNKFKEGCKAYCDVVDENNKIIELSLLQRIEEIKCLK